MNALPHQSASQPVLELLNRIHKEISGIKDGSVATYIPELAKANPDWFGICLVTANGTIYEVGDTRQEFTIQSISKPFVYGMALEDQGREDVLKKVGVEPTGDVFNSISLEPGTGRPRNPMINAGAIATTGLIGGVTEQGRLRRMMGTFSTYAGRELRLDESVFASENETGHRNRAIGHMLRNFDILTSDPIPVVELYFKQCSISVTCRDLGIMAATLANRGINPVSGKQAIRGEYVSSVLSVMESCGTYDFAGEWIYHVGLPAKSGVAGGMIAVLPGQLGIGVFSPPLDERGNSVRSIEVCKRLSNELDLHQLDRHTMGRATIRRKLSGSEFNSSRVRTAAEQQRLREQGREIQTYQLQGHLTFSTTETVVHDIMEHAEDIGQLILDFKRVIAVNECSCRMLHLMLENLRAQGKPAHLVHTAHLPLMRRYLKAKLGDQFESVLLAHEDLDSALEWCEEQLLTRSFSGAAAQEESEAGEYDLLRGFTAEETAVLKACLKPCPYKKGEVIIKAGDEARELFFLAAGHVSVMVPIHSGSLKRLATFTAGTIFGEMAVIDRAPRSAMIMADTDVKCELLSLEDIDRLGRTHPGIKIKLLENLSLGLCGKLRKANREIAMLE